MNYYGLLLLVLVSLIAAVLVQGEDLFSSSFFITAYVAMSLALVIGSKYVESFKMDSMLGLLLIFAVGFMSTEILIEMITNKFTGTLIFKIAIIVSLDYCAMGFLRGGMKMKKVEELKKDDRYGIYEPKLKQ